MQRTRVVCVLAVAAAMAAGCGGQAVRQGPASSSAPIKVDVIGPQSGQNAPLGDWDWKGASLAVNEANARGGVGGRKIELTQYNDQGDPTTGANLAKRAVSDRATAVFGPPQSTVALAAEPVLTAAEIPQMVSAQAVGLTQQGSRYIFLDTATSPAFDSTLADYLVNTLHASAIAMVSNNDAYGQGEHTAFLAELAKLQVRPVSDKVVTPDQKDFTAVLTDVRQTSPAYLFLGTEEVEAGLIAKQARSLGITATFAIGAPGVTPTFLDTAGAETIEGTIVSAPYLSNDANATTKAFGAAYRKAYGVVPEFHGAKAYDGMNVLIAAMRKTPGDLSGAKLSGILHSGAFAYSGLQGRFVYDATGVAIKQTHIGRIKNGVVTANGA